MEELGACPICKGSETGHWLTCKDHTVSQECFDIVRCRSCGFRFTNPRPEESRIGQYYQSEDYISHSNTKKGLINTLYHWVRLYTVRKKFARVQRWAPEASILDHGVGTGEFLAYCKEQGWETLGLEPDEGAREFAGAEYGLDVRPDETLWELEDKKYGVITLWHVLEHVPRLRETIEQLRRVLHDRGTLFVAVPNCSSYDAWKYENDWAAYDVPRHLYHFIPSDIERLFGLFDMKVRAIKPMKFDAFYVSMMSEKHGGGSILKGALNGWRSNWRANDKNHRYSSQLYILQKN